MTINKLICFWEIIKRKKKNRYLIMNLDPLLPYLKNYMTDLFGGPKFIKARYVANFFKGGTLFYLIFLMRIFDNFSLGAIIYTILHSSYGMLWLLKVVLKLKIIFDIIILFFI